MALVTFVLFYICSAYLLAYNVKVARISFLDALQVQIYGSVIFGITTIIAGKLGDRYGRREMLIWSTVVIGLFSFALAPLLSAGITGIYAFATLGMAIFGINYGLIGTALAAPFPTAVRYTGASITFNLAGIFGASLAPYIATWLQANYGLGHVGYYLLFASIITLICILVTPPKEI